MPQVENSNNDGTETTQPATYDIGDPNFNLDEVKKVAQAYYSNTVFEAISMEVKSRTQDEIVFSVCVSKGGVMQNLNRTIFLFAVEEWRLESRQ